MKPLLCIGLLGLALGFSAAPLARAQEVKDYPQLSGGTNNVAAATTNTYNKTFNCSEVENVEVDIGFVCSGDANSNMTFVISEKVGTLGYETTPKWRIPVAAHSNSVVQFTTNLYVPGAAGLCFTNVEWPKAGIYGTNLYLNFRPKVPRKLMKPG